MWTQVPQVPRYTCLTIRQPSWVSVQARTQSLVHAVQFSHSVMSDSLQPQGLQHTRPPCPSPTPGVCSNSCPLSRWCHTPISSPVIPFSSCLQSLPASGYTQGSLKMPRSWGWAGTTEEVSYAKNLQTGWKGLQAPRQCWPLESWGESGQQHWCSTHNVYLTHFLLRSPLPKHRTCLKAILHVK